MVIHWVYGPVQGRQQHPTHRFRRALIRHDYLARDYLYGEYSPHGTNLWARIINFHFIITVNNWFNETTLLLNASPLMSVFDTVYTYPHGNSENMFKNISNKTQHKPIYTECKSCAFIDRMTLVRPTYTKYITMARNDIVCLNPLAHR